MPHHKSCKKRLKQSARQRIRNNAVKTVLRRTMKESRQALEQGQDIDMNEVHSIIDKAWNKGVLHKNKAARLKSRLSKAASRKSAEAS